MQVAANGRTEMVKNDGTANAIDSNRGSIYGTKSLRPILMLIQSLFTVEKQVRSVEPALEEKTQPQRREKGINERQEGRQSRGMEDPKKRR